jgi:hypothetical protein
MKSAQLGGAQGDRCQELAYPRCRRRQDGRYAGFCLTGLERRATIGRQGKTTSREGLASHTGQAILAVVGGRPCQPMPGENLVAGLAHLVAGELDDANLVPLGAGRSADRAGREGQRPRAFGQPANCQLDQVEFTDLMRGGVRPWIFSRC